MDSFRQFVAKTFMVPPTPGSDASAVDLEEFEKTRTLALQKRAAAERSLLSYKMKRGTWAREAVWENAKEMSMPDFWFLYGSEDPELQTVAMRCGQVSGAGSAERGHKVMNLVETKTKNNLDWDNVEAWIYVKHNSSEADKREKLDYDNKVIRWTDGVEVNEEWVDAWEEASARDEEMPPRLREDMITRATEREERMRGSVSRRIVPQAAPATRSGRIVNPPRVLTF
ncbi:hypothetical protein CYMTET_7029 [Cymbomonas tetramitiformis]|uniref:Uncharacterized protein n=1 Tax=Cymbomonas tetramitiformis TaxID=36881 RepID=A0AAE0GW86_9CHLO|nr:hypothetical protein CYMTET_7029 [Cymbomonas tetramitiformis]